MSGAAFSQDRVYRYRLWRAWPPAEYGVELIGSLVVIGLNPSTADETEDDPTIRRCIGFAKRLGMARLEMLNLFAYRSTDPRELGRVDAPVGPYNDNAIREVCASSSLIVAAWGTRGDLHGRDAEVVKLLQSRRVWCLGKTKNGHPKHPLYLRADTKLQEFA